MTMVPSREDCMISCNTSKISIGSYPVKFCKKLPRTCETVPVKVPALAAPPPCTFQFHAAP